MAFLTKPEADLLLEVSWETCNKVGGIYTVLLSKTNQIIKYYKNYYLIGPYLPDSETLRSEFKESQPDKNLKIVFQELSQQGINCHFGEWMIEGRPKIILVDFSGIQEQVNQIKTELWEDYSIDSLSAGFDFTEPVVWSYACSK